MDFSLKIIFCAPISGGGFIRLCDAAQPVRMTCAVKADHDVTGAQPEWREGCMDGEGMGKVRGMAVMQGGVADSRGVTRMEHLLSGC
jgi:hypothetical protein